MSIDIEIRGYEILSELGAGGMATVYLAIQTSLERQVAIKVLHSALSQQSEEFKQRFFHEGKVLAKVAHPNIVTIYDIDESNGLLYMAMEYVAGGTLADRLKVEQLTVDESTQVCAQVALALHTTHMHHIVHRDLKPSNVLMRDGYTPLLTDFGIARQTDVDIGLTQTGHIVGTMQYMSPEQIRGMKVDHRSDIYSLGLMYYRLLVGQLPFVASGHYELSRMQCEEPPPPLPPQLAEFQPVMDVMLAKDPNDRFQTALEFCKTVQNLKITNEEFRTELTQQTRIYDSSQMAYSGSYGSDRMSGPRSGSQSGEFSGQVSARQSGRQEGPYAERDSGRVSQRQSREQSLGTQGFGAPASGKLKKILMFGVPAFAALVAVLLYFMIWFEPDTGLSEADQRRVDNYLRRVDADLLKMQIDSPPEDNAVYELNKALALAPNYKPALDKAREIAEFYETDARDLLDANRLEDAAGEIRKGLDLAPGFEPLVQLQESLNETLAERQRLADVAAALAQAEQYLSAGQLIEPEDQNAYTEFKKVIALDRLNPVAMQGLRSIEKDLVDQAESNVSAGQLEIAQQQLEKVESLFPGSRLATGIKDTIADQVRLAREQQEVDTYLQTAQQQMSDGKFVEPADDNALDSYTRVLTLRSENAEALQGLQDIASRYATRARSALEQGDFNGAVQLAESGLLADQYNAELLAVQQQATGQLSAKEQEIQSQLQQAQRLLSAGNFLPPGDNALDLFQSVMSLDPGNAQAERGLARLPNQVYDEAVQDQLGGYYSESLALLSAAQSAFPDDERFTTLKATLEQQVTQQQQEQRLQDLLNTSKAIIAARPVTLDTIDRAAQALENVRSEFPNDLTAGNQLSELVQAVAEQANLVGGAGNEDAGFLLLDRALGHFSGNQTLLDTRGSLERRRDQRLAAEQARIAAITGQLAIDAVPWGEVVEILDANGKKQSLPSNTSTPLVISLLAGRYTVSVSDDNGGQPVQLAVNVTAQQVATTTAEFNSITAEEYFKRSGW